MVGGFLVAIAGFNFQSQYYVRPGDLPKYVPVFISVGSFMIACGGFWMFLKVRVLINSLRYCHCIDLDDSLKILFGPLAVFPLQQIRVLDLYSCK